MAGYWQTILRMELSPWVWRTSNSSAAPRRHRLHQRMGMTRWSVRPRAAKRLRRVKKPIWRNQYSPLVKRQRNRSDVFAEVVPPEQKCAWNNRRTEVKVELSF